MNSFDRPRAGRFDETWSLLEVAVSSDLVLAFLHGVSVGICRPGKGSSAAKRFVAPRKGGVYDVFAVTANGHEAGQVSGIIMVGKKSHRPLGLCCRL